MERTYLNGWRTFFERTADVPKAMENLLKRSDLGKEDIFSSFRALNVCRFEARSLRDKIADKYAKNVTKGKACDL